MKTKIYEAPAIEVIEVEIEGVVCASIAATSVSGDDGNSSITTITESYEQ